MGNKLFRITSNRATQLAFFIAGFATAAWAVLVPYARSNTGVNEATLGSLLLCLGGGAFIAMPITGILTSRFGCRRVIALALALVIVSLPLLASISTPILLGLTLLVFGIGVGITDCAMNIQAILVEKSSSVPLMSGFHGMYSFGGITGSCLMTLLLAIGFNVEFATILIALTVALLLIISFRGLLTYANPQEGAVFAIPRGIVLIIGIICFSVFLTEGTVLDWSAVYLTQAREMPEKLGGLGYASFAIAMTAARLKGDKIIQRFGQLKIVVSGAIIAALGLAIVTFIPSWHLSLLGYVLVGAGCANIVPVMFSAVGKQRVMPQSVAVPAITTMGYLGVLSGPAILGYVAHLSSLATAFTMIMVLMLLVSGISFTVNLKQDDASKENR